MTAGSMRNARYYMTATQATGVICLENSGSLSEGILGKAVAYYLGDRFNISTRAALGFG